MGPCLCAASAAAAAAAPVDAGAGIASAITLLQLPIFLEPVYVVSRVSLQPNLLTTCGYRVLLIITLLSTQLQMD